jgi:hypothetical protein
LLFCVEEEGCGPSFCNAAVRLRSSQMAGLQILTELLKILTKLLPAAVNALGI